MQIEALECERETKERRASVSFSVLLVHSHSHSPCSQRPCGLRRPCRPAWWECRSTASGECRTRIWERSSCRNARSPACTRRGPASEWCRPAARCVRWCYSPARAACTAAGSPPCKRLDQVSTQKQSTECMRLRRNAEWVPQNFSNLSNWRSTFWRSSAKPPTLLRPVIVTAGAWCLSLSTVLPTQPGTWYTLGPMDMKIVGENFLLPISRLCSCGITVSSYHYKNVPGVWSALRVSERRPNE